MNTPSILFWTRYQVVLCLLLLLNFNSNAADRYWVGSGNWHDSSNWSASAGGAGGASIPDNLDVAIFDGGGDCNIETSINVMSMQIRDGFNNAISVIDSSIVLINCCGYTQANGTLTASSLSIMMVYGNMDISDGEFDHSGLLIIQPDPDFESIQQFIIRLVLNALINRFQPDIYMDFEDSVEPFEEIPARDPDPDGTGNGCFSNDWNAFYKTDICVAESRPLSDIAVERSDRYARAGSYSERFYIQPSPLDDWPPGEATHRVELAPQSNSPFNVPYEGDIVWYGASYYFPSDFVFAPDDISNDIRFIISQWQHGSPGSPSLSFEVHGDMIALAHKTGVSTDAEFHEPIPLETISRGEWMDFVIKVKWSQTNGVVEIWVNGEKKFDDQSIQTIYDDLDHGGRFKFGMYYWRWKEIESVEDSLEAGITYREIFIDEVRQYMGLEGYNTVVPSN